MHTIGSIAREIGRPERTVRQWARKAGIQPISGVYVLSDAEKSRCLAAGTKKSGCPKFVAGNDLWKHRKKSESKS